MEMRENISNKSSGIFYGSIILRRSLMIDEQKNIVSSKVFNKVIES